MLIKEACLENYTLISRAISCGANRIELCDNLSCGGTTVSKGVMAESLRYAHEKKVPVTVLIRPRGGDFVYNDAEIKIMESDIFTAQSLGADTVAIGALDSNGGLDFEAMENLAQAAFGMQLELHMAFDSLNFEEQKKAIDWAVSSGFDRILTHGGPLEVPIGETVPHLKELISYADHRIEILPGGGITFENCEQIAEELGVKSVHGTKIVNLMHD